MFSFFDSEVKLSYLQAFQVFPSIVPSLHHDDRDVTPREGGQLLVQVMGCLRNLSVNKRHLSAFWAANVVPVVMESVGRLVRHAELMLNISRLLA